MTGSDLQTELNWLYSTQLFGIKLGLENVQKLLASYSPALPSKTQVIQVAGTNGKGSTSAFIESVARAQGMRTGLFTSPHLVEFAERIRVSGQMIPDDRLCLLLRDLRELVADWDPHPTFFELSLALAMRYFTERRCELLILEVGMGGRLDATTAVESDVAVITPIAMDHERYLGETLELIAREKGGILREGGRCFSAPQEECAAAVLTEIASEKRSELTFIKAPLAGYHLGLYGKHQRWNAALALEALHALRGPLSYDAVVEGLRGVNWPGRFHILEQQERVVVLDCCHNPHAADRLVSDWKARFGAKKAHLILGGCLDKDLEGVLRTLMPIVEKVDVYEIKNPRAASTGELLALVQSISSELVGQVLQKVPPVLSSSHTLVTGSLFLIGEWLESSASSEL